MKLFKTLFLLLPVWCLSSCILGDADEPVEPIPCESTYNEWYNDYQTIAFTIQDSDTLYQNYGFQTYGERPADYLVEVYVPQGYATQVEFTFTRIIVEGDECAARKQHQLIVVVDIDQRPHESKEYTIGSKYSQVNRRSHATYLGDAIDPSEFWRNSVGDDNGTFTITKYIPERVIRGSFNINVDGIAATGEFDIDLTTDY